VDWAAVGIFGIRLWRSGDGMSQANLPNKILVVDDDLSVAQSLEEPLSRYNIRVDKATNLDTAFYLFNQQRYEVVLIEVEYGPLPGLALVQKWRNHEVVDKRSCGFVMLLGNKSLDGANEGLVRELGDLEVLNKPFGMIQLLPYLSRGIATQKRLAAYHDMKTKIVSYYEKSGDFDKAAEQVQKRLPELGPKGLSILYDLYEKGNRFEDALNIVQPMIERDQNNISLLNAKGRLLMRLGRFTEAREVMERSDKVAPQNIERLNEMATMYLQLKQPEQSVKKFKEVLDLNPENPEMKFEMFAKLYDHGYDDHAVSFGKQSAKPMEIVRHYNNKGVLLSKDGKGDQALIDYQRALKFFPKFKENFRIYFNIALAYTQLKTLAGFEEAHKHLKMCLELEPTFEKAQKAIEQVEKSLETLRRKAG
jgi:tetratricopeptide (TPR) repeat protein